MESVILAAGRGSRLEPLTNKKPKPLAIVGGKTIIEHTLDYAVTAGITSATIVVGYKAEQIKTHLGESYRGINITYVHQDEKLGLAHATLQAKDTIEGDVFALFFSDIIYENPPLDDLKRCMDNSTPAVFVDNVPIEDASSYGVCEIVDGVVESVVEKPENPPSNKIIAGTYVLPKEIFSYCSSISPSDRGEYEITDAINAYLQDVGNIEFIEIEGGRVDVAYMEDLFKARLLEEKGVSDLSEIIDQVH